MKRTAALGGLLAAIGLALAVGGYALLPPLLELGKSNPRIIEEFVGDIRFENHGSLGIAAGWGLPVGRGNYTVYLNATGPVSLRIYALNSLLLDQQSECPRAEFDDESGNFTGWYEPPGSQLLGEVENTTQATHSFQLFEASMFCSPIWNPDRASTVAYGMAVTSSDAWRATVTQDTLYVDLRLYVLFAGLGIAIAAPAVLAFQRLWVWFRKNRPPETGERPEL